MLSSSSRSMPPSRVRETPAPAESGDATASAAIAQAHMLDQTRDAIVVQTLDGIIGYWNLGAQRIFGYTREQALGKRFEDLLGRGAALTPQALADLLAHGEWRGELECVSADAMVLTVERRCTVLRGADGQPTSVVTVDTDVTEQRRSEKEIVLLSNVLEQRIRKRTAQLEESNQELRNFAYSLAHDLRAPLASIDGFSAQLERELAGRLNEKSLRYLARVRVGVKVMSDFIEALLALAKLSNAQLLRDEVNLSQLAQCIIQRRCELEPDRQVAVRIEETPAVVGDARLLTNVLENLLGNAWKFTSKTPFAEIAFGAEIIPGNACRYYVRDNGAGFDPAYAHKLFGPFQRLHSPSEFKGTGMGLAMVRKIVSRHGGRAWAESGVGAGATFYFTLNEPAPVPRRGVDVAVPAT